MSDEPKIHQRSRPRQGSADVERMDVDRGVARRGQALVEQAIEASLTDAQAGGGGDRRPRPADEAAAAASPRKRGGKVGGTGDGDYEVGYGKPPKHAQFKKGQGGNPKGRPRKIKKHADAGLEELLAEVQVVNVNGKPTRMTMREIGERRLIQNYAKGDLKAVRFVHQMLDRQRALEEAEAQSSDDGLLRPPSAEVLQILAEAKAAELKSAPGLPDLSDEQIAIILAMFGMGLENGEVSERASGADGRSVNVDDGDDENDDAGDG